MRKKCREGIITLQTPLDRDRLSESKSNASFPHFPAWRLPCNTPFHSSSSSLWAQTANHSWQSLSVQQLCGVHTYGEGQDHQTNRNLWPNQGSEPKSPEMKGYCTYFSSKKPFGVHIDHSPGEKVSDWCTAAQNGSVNVCDVQGLVNGASLLLNELLAKQMGQLQPQTFLFKDDVSRAQRGVDSGMFLKILSFQRTFKYENLFSFLFLIYRDRKSSLRGITEMETSYCYLVIMVKIHLFKGSLLI